MGAKVLRDDDRSGWRRRGRNLEYLTIGWNSLEAAVAIGAGLIAGSTALVGFGVDSIIETSSGAVLLWRLRDGTDNEARERISLVLLQEWTLSYNPPSRSNITLGESYA